MTKRIKLSEVNQKRLRIFIYLLTSGFLGYVLATYVANNPALTAIFTPTINFILYSLVEELKKEGYIEGIRQEKEAK